MILREFIKKTIKEYLNEQSSINVIGYKKLIDLIYDYYKYNEYVDYDINDKVLNWLYNQILAVIDELKEYKIDTGDYLNVNNWGLKKDGNLAIFDIGYGNYFDDFENENLPIYLDIKDSENNNILKKLLDKYGITKSKYLGSGLFGHAHDIGNGKVLKITTDKTEAINSKKIQGKNLKHIANIYSVSYFEMNDKTFYVIILEKLKLSKKLTNDFKRLENYFNNKICKNLDKTIIYKIRKKHPIVSKFLEDMIKIGYEKTWDKWREYLVSNALHDKYDFNDISEISEWIKGSITNKNDNEDEPPYYIAELVNSLIENKEIKENVLKRYIKEGVNDIKEFNLLVNNIITFFAEENYPLINRINKRGYDNIHFNNDSEYIKNMCDSNDFSILKKFIERSNVRIYFVLDSLSSQGVYTQYKVIKINQSINEFKDNIKYQISIVKKDPDDNSISSEDCKRILKSALGVAFRNILLHELQHAYDDFRSNGNYRSDKLSKKYYKDIKYDAQDINSKMSEEERKIYLSLPHEYWARFNEFLNEIDGFNFHRKDIKFFLDYLENNFTGYEHISEEGKRKLKKSLYKFYLLKTKNKEIKENVLKRYIKGIVLESLKENKYINEYITNDVILLKDYLNMTKEQKLDYLPYEYYYCFEDFLIEKDIDFNKPKEVVSSNYEDEPYEEVDKFEYYDYEFIEWLKNNNKKVYDAFSEYLYDKINNGELPIDSADYPAWYYFDKPELIKNQWLIHFTNNSEKIAREGFKYGVNDYTKLGLTTHFGDFEKEYGGYNFAYTLNDFKKYSRNRLGYKYGNEAVIFNASGIKVWHYGDEEPQVIFYGNTAKNIIPISNGEESAYGIYSYKGNLLYENDDLEKVVKWLISNYVQYRKKLLNK